MRGAQVARSALLEAYRHCLIPGNVTGTPFSCIACKDAAISSACRSIQQVPDTFIRHATAQSDSSLGPDGLSRGAYSASTFAAPPMAASVQAPSAKEAHPRVFSNSAWFPWSSSAWQQQPLRSVHSSSIMLADVEVKVPPMGESITEGSIATVLVKPGDPVKEDDVLAQIETDKVTVDVKYNAKEAGVVRQVLVKESDTVSVGQPVVVVEQGATAEAATPEPVKDSPPTPAADTSTPPPPPPPKPAAPAATHTPAAAPPTKAAPSLQSPTPSPSPIDPKSRPVKRVKMTRLRLRVAERLKGAQNTYAMLTTFNEVDMTALMSLRNQFKDLFLEKHGVKLGFMSAFVKATASALLEVPAVNAVIDGTDIVYKEYVDISIAVATPKGLVVPVIRNANQLSFADVERTMNSLAKKARDGTISIDEMAGGTFTISNGGVYGSMLSTPIINPPQSAILGMHNIQKRAWVVGDKIEPRPIMYIALTYDHRLIDGREAVTFLKRIKEVVEDPRRLILDV